MVDTPSASVGRTSKSHDPLFKVLVCLAIAFHGSFLSCSAAPPTPTPTPVDIWVEIDYSAAYSAVAPAWAFSDTPGWVAADWAWTGETSPEVWDVYNNITVEADPIGKCAILGSGATLQVMIGLKKLVSYGSIVVHLEGRSASSSSSVSFDVYNPLNSTGTSGSFDQDWKVHSLDLDLGTAAVCGEEQAIRIEPTGGSSSMALARMRITLHDAVW
jgi:hypothetical protein